MIAHVVLFEPKHATTVGERDAFLDLMRVAVSEIDAVRRSFIGLRKLVGAGYESRIGDTTYSYASVVEFDDVDGLKSYLEHPLHVKIGQLFWQHCERTLIIDAECFWVNDKKITNNAS
jgi:hypothetical protein